MPRSTRSSSRCWAACEVSGEIDIGAAPSTVRMAPPRDEPAPGAEPRVDEPRAAIGRGKRVAAAGRVAVELVEHVLGALEHVDVTARGAAS